MRAERSSPAEAATFSTTQLYINLAGEEFREEAELLERRLLGVEDLGRSLSSEATEGEERADREAAISSDFTRNGAA